MSCAPAVKEEIAEPQVEAESVSPAALGPAALEPAALGPATPVAPLEPLDDVEDETDKENKAPTDDNIVAEWFDAINNALTACAGCQESKQAWVARRGRKAS